MKVSELIKDLQVAKAQYGDLVVLQHHSTLGLIAITGCIQTVEQGANVLQIADCIEFPLDED